MGKVHGAAVHVVLQATGCGHDDLRALFQLFDLLLNIRAAIDGDDADVRIKMRQVLQVFGDLLRQLPRGRHDDGLRVIPALVQPENERDAESAGFTRARGRFGDDVLALHHRGDRLFLYFGHFGKAHALHSLVDLLGHVQFAVIHASLLQHIFSIPFFFIQNSVYHILLKKETRAYQRDGSHIEIFYISCILKLFLLRKISSFQQPSQYIKVIIILAVLRTVDAFVCGCRRQRRLYIAANEKYLPSTLLLLPLQHLPNRFFRIGQAGIVPSIRPEEQIGLGALALCKLRMAGIDGCYSAANRIVQRTSTPHVILLGIKLCITDGKAIIQQYILVVKQYCRNIVISPPIL